MTLLEQRKLIEEELAVYAGRVDDALKLYSNLKAAHAAKSIQLSAVVLKIDQERTMCRNATRRRPVSSAAIRTQLGK